MESKMDNKFQYFSNKQLRDMIVPLFFEQLLVMLVGLVDTFVITYAGEAAVSGVSLVNQFSMIFMYLFTALASGGAVVISQYIGKKDYRLASKSASQLLMFSIVISVIIALLVGVFKSKLMLFMFGRVDTKVMDSCIIYLKITVLSFPFIAIYNVGAALFRSLGNTSITMKISFLSNIINLLGDFIFVLGLHWGIAGVAWPTVAARLFSAVVIVICSFSQKNAVSFIRKDIFCWDKKLLNCILRIAIPNGIENGIFQFVKVALSSIVALFGTYQIAANGVAQSIWSLAAVFSVAMAPVYTTVVGQCMGAGNKDAADYYLRKLLYINVIASIVWNIFILLLTPAFLRWNHLADETKHLVLILVIIHNLFNSFALPFFGNLGTGMRAAGDVKFTMFVTIVSTIGGRLFLSILFAMWFNMGVIGIAIAMCLDWIIRGTIFYIRFRSKKWQVYKVI